MWLTEGNYSEYRSGIELYNSHWLAAKWSKDILFYVIISSFINETNILLEKKINNLYNIYIYMCVDCFMYKSLRISVANMIT